MPNLTETAAKATSKPSALKGAPASLGGVFRQLAAEHEEAVTLLASATLVADAATRTDLWRKIRQELTAHEHAELEVVYSEFEMHASLMDIVRQHESDADQLEILIGNVDTSPIASEQWESCMRQLLGAVVRHATREEQDFFPRAQEVIGERRAEELAEQYLAERNDLLDGPSE